MEIPFISETKMYHEIFDNMSEEEFEEELRKMEERHAAIMKEREERKRKESESTDEIYLQEIVFKAIFPYRYLSDGETIRISLSRKEISATSHFWDKRYQIVKRKISDFMEKDAIILLSEKPLYSFGFILSEEQYRTLLPLCKAVDYEVYREEDVYEKHKIEDLWSLDGPNKMLFEAASYSKYPLVKGRIATRNEEYDLPANRLYNVAKNMIDEYRKSLEPQKRKKKIIKQNKKNRETENMKERK